MRGGAVNIINYKIGDKMNINNIDQVMNVANFQSVSQEEIETTASDVTSLPTTDMGCYTISGCE